jgi:hypothetical protein
MKPLPKYLSKAPLTRYGTKRLTKKELLSLAKKKKREKRNASGVPVQ